MCNGIDDDCDGQIDEDFGIGAACDGPDSDLCEDDVVTCNGCSAGDDNVEVCNGIDDDCDGTIDADCALGACTPTLLVTQVVPSTPNCFVDAVQVGSRGKLTYQCGGGSVSATFGSIVSTGSVLNDSVELRATTTFEFRDGCTWQSTQRISGQLSSGRLTYAYEESPIAGSACAPPCTADGSIEVVWN